MESSWGRFVLATCTVCGADNAKDSSTCFRCGGRIKPDAPVSRSESRDTIARPRSDGQVHNELCLCAVNGSNAGKEFQITPPGVTIGRHPTQNQLVVDDPEISRQHARIFFEHDGSLQIEDTSTNG